MQLENPYARQSVREAIESVTPLDKLEETHKEDALSWIDSGVEIFRIAKPDKPPKHLVSYFVPIDIEHKSVLLVDHKKALLWLPPGGHIEPNEAPDETVRRECLEELGLKARFAYGAKPFFVTQAATVGLTAGHVDVSLWYVIEAEKNDEIAYDKREFNGIRWFGFDEIAGMHGKRLDPNFPRFMHKLLDKTKS